MLNSVIFWKLLDMFILIIEWISLYILVNDLSTRKVSKNQSLLSFSLILGISFAMNLFGIFPNLRVFISIVLSIFYVKLSYEVNLSKALTIPLVYWMMLIGIEALSISSIVYVNNINVILLLFLLEDAQTELVFRLLCNPLYMYHTLRDFCKFLPDQRSYK